LAVTITDVARLAGVCPATVSRYINGATNIDPKIRERVSSAMHELGYMPNTFAQSLRQNRSRTIGIIASDMSVDFFARLSREMEMGLLPNEYAAFSVSTYDQPEIEKNTLRLMASRRVDALLVCSSNQNDELLMEINKSGIPIILYDRRSRTIDFPTVYVDKRKAMILALDHLFALGHRNVAMITGARTLSTNYDRFMGMQDYAFDHGVASSNFVSRFGMYTPEYAEQAMDELMSMKTPPTAVICGSISNTVGVITYCRRKGLRFPDDISVISFGTFSYPQLVEPAITYISDGTEALAKALIDILMPVMNGGQIESGKSVVIEPELVIQKSCKKLI